MVRGEPGTDDCKGAGVGDGAPGRSSAEEARISGTAPGAQEGDKQQVGAETRSACGKSCEAEGKRRTAGTGKATARALPRHAGRLLCAARTGTANRDEG